ncbi:MAG: o-succinylbenzoate synthase [Actinobacteria bacterium]|nr:o-succinylbenzoate synthase [Actinomycetota bacterium]MDA2984676.1 o-succinylbenzoate synthase [Actinomycetota bacterium]
MLTLEEIFKDFHLVKLNLKTPFRGVSYREVALLKGPSGWGEFSPFLEYDQYESASWLAAGIEAAFGDQTPLERDEISINATLPAINDRESIEKIMALYPGAKTVKIKVGNDKKVNLARIATVKEIDSDLKIRLDVNGSWSVEEAVDNLKDIQDQIEYVEQPCSSLDELRALKRRIDVPIAVDELLRKNSDPFSLNLEDVADFLVLKVSPLGGVTRAKKMAEHYQIPVVVSSALESAVGISQGLQLAAALKGYSNDSGLATGVLFESDVGAHPIIAGKIRVSMIEPIGLLANSCSVDRIEWWQRRVKDSFEIYRKLCK